MEPITLIAAGLLCMTIGAKLAPKPTIKSDSYSLSQIREVVSVMDQDSVITGIERLIPVSINGDEPATLYDLNGDEGYLVLGENYKIFDYQQKIEVIKDLPKSDIAFNPINRAFTLGTKERFSVADNHQKQSNDYEEALCKGSFVDHGCGEIEENDLGSYLEEKFPGGELDDEFSLAMRRWNQSDLSVYKERIMQDGEERWKPEDNCVLCAMFTIFDYLVNFSEHKDTDFSGFPKNGYERLYYPANEEPSTYKWAMSKPNGRTFKAFEKSLGNWSAKRLSDLCIDIRKTEVSFKTNGPIDGINVDQAVATMEAVARENGLESFDATKDTNYNAYVGTQDFKDFLMEDKPLYFASHGSTYGNHAMAVSGYKYYKRTVKVLFWDKIEWATFLEIGDGWSTNIRYFDITRYFWEGCGNAEFIKYVW